MIEEEYKKRIAELEKENAELKTQKDNSVYIDNLTSKIIDLEKENTELKAQIEKMKRCGNCCYFDDRFEYTCISL